MKRRFNAGLSFEKKLGFLPKRLSLGCNSRRHHQLAINLNRGLMFVRVRYQRLVERACICGFRTPDRWRWSLRRGRTRNSRTVRGDGVGRGEAMKMSAR